MDALSELSRAIRANFMNLGAQATVEEAETRSWASVTFTGARHKLRVRVTDPERSGAVDRFLEGLSEDEFDLRSHILADIALVSNERQDGDDQVLLTLEALTVEDC